MIILNDKILEDKENLSIVLENEKKLINSSIEQQNTLKAISLEYMQKIAYSNDNIDTLYADIIVDFLKDLKNSLEQFQINIDLLNNLTKTIDDINLELHKNDINLNYESIESFNNNFFESINTVSQNTLQIQEVIQSVIKYSQLSFLASESKLRIKTESPTEDTTKPDSETLVNIEIPQTDDNQFPQNTLIISETKGKIVLPFTTSSLNELYKNNYEKYSDIKDVIKQEYTLPLELYKNSSISRFKEAFKLVKSKENGSIKDAFDLGMELLFNYNLHPAIISACKNLDELDIYLDCLDNNETDKFDCFKIVFEIPPTVVKNKKVKIWYLNFFCFILKS